ncbi:peritrophin-1-like isoform X2 [Venturia canescens]|uniref:peritrophin-1-like isoform X2 n=1 Tax=Venturia canescens TaxID=32260 RepID=UPI001C9C35C6|nr:peritrophin-1-like isoform X2 [Venturia canescens]
MMNIFATEPECLPEYTGYQRYPGTCDKYLHCDRGQTFIKSCGPGTAWNQASFMCDWPTNVPGCAAAAASTPRPQLEEHGSNPNGENGHDHKHGPAGRDDEQQSETYVGPVTNIDIRLGPS